MADQVKSGDVVVADVRKVETAKLSVPLKRGEKDVSEITVSNPSNGAMKGLRIFAVMEGDVQQLSILLPRITNPAITENEFQMMPLCDQTEFAGKILRFLDK